MSTSDQPKIPQKPAPIAATPARNDNPEPNADQPPENAEPATTHPPPEVGTLPGKRRILGRPRIISSPEEMDRLVEEYVEACRQVDEPLTLTGLILSIGLSGRSALDNYGGREGFLHSVKRAKTLVAYGYEVDLRRKGQHPAGPIFALKNLGWADRQELAVSGGLTNKVDIASLPDALVARIAAGESIVAVLAGAAESYVAALPPAQATPDKPADVAEVAE